MFHYFTIRPGVLNDGFPVSGFSFRMPRGSGFLEQYYRFQSQDSRFPGKNSWIPESEFPYIVLGAENMYILH